LRPGPIRELSAADHGGLDLHREQAPTTDLLDVGDLYIYDALPSG
jgi:hypothetical protein